MCGKLLSTSAYRAALDRAGYTPIDSTCTCGTVISTDELRGKDGLCGWCYYKAEKAREEQSNGSPVER